MSTVLYEIKSSDNLAATFADIAERWTVLISPFPRHWAQNGSLDVERYFLMLFAKHPSSSWNEYSNIVLRVENVARDRYPFTDDDTLAPWVAPHATLATPEHILKLDDTCRKHRCDKTFTLAHAEHMLKEDRVLDKLKRHRAHEKEIEDTRRYLDTLLKKEIL